MCTLKIHVVDQTDSDHNTHSTQALSPSGMFYLFSPSHDQVPIPHDCIPIPHDCIPIPQSVIFDLKYDHVLDFPVNIR